MSDASNPQVRVVAPPRTPTVAVEIGRQLGGGKGGSAVLERSGLELGQSATEFAAKTDDTGGDGGSGNKVNNGGGGGDGDEGDDDAYGEGDEDGPEDGFLALRDVLAEQFDAASLGAVLAEWGRTLAALPAGLRLAAQMGLVSSRQLARALALDARPGAVRAARRALPAPVGRALTGRLVADPGFLGKLATDAALTAAAAAAAEVVTRGDALRAEAGLAGVNVAGAAAVSLAATTLFAPSRALAPPALSGWGALLGRLPSHAFEAAQPLRPLGVAARVASFGLRSMQLAAVGAAVGSAAGAANSALLSRRAARGVGPPRVPALGARSAASAYAAFAALSAAPRYTLLAGADRWAHDRLASLGAAVGVSTAARAASVAAGDRARAWLLRLPKPDWAAWADDRAAAGVAAAAAGERRRRAAAARAPPPRDADADRVRRVARARARAQRAAAASASTAGGEGAQPRRPLPPAGTGPQPPRPTGGFRVSASQTARSQGTRGSL